MTKSEESLVAQHKLWTIPNLLSISRIFLLIPIIWFLLQEGAAARWIAIGLIAIAMLTDFFDGRIARWTNEVSEEGKILDPLADKIAVGIGVIVIAMIGELPWWYVGIIIGRDVLIILAGIYIKSRYNVVFPSNIWGKWAVTFITFAVFVVLLPVEGLALLERILIWISVVFLFISTVSYAHRFLTAGKVAGSGVGR